VAFESGIQRSGRDDTTLDKRDVEGNLIALDDNAMLTLKTNGRRDWVDDFVLDELWDGRELHCFVLPEWCDVSWD